MASVAEFVQNPSEELLKALSWEQLLKVAEHFDIECPKQARKDTWLSRRLHSSTSLPSVEECSTEKMPTEEISSPEPAKLFVILVVLELI